MAKMLAAKKKKTYVINPISGKRESHFIKDYPGHPRWCTDINELWTQMSLYVEYMSTNELVMSMAGLAVFLGCSKETLNVYRRGEYDLDSAKYSEAIEVIRTVIEKDKLEGGLLDKYNATITKFDLVNNHGYMEKTSQEVTGKDGGAVQIESVSDTDFARRFLWILHNVNKEKGEEDGKRIINYDSNSN